MQRTRMNLAVVVTGLWLCAGCSGGAAKVTSVLFDPAHPLPPRPADAPIQMFSAQRPGCRFSEIGTVSVEGGGPLPSREIALAMQRRAREMGGDAIVGMAQGSRPAGPDEASPRAGGTSVTLRTGTVIRFRDSSCAN